MVASSSAARRYAFTSGLALAYSLALLGDQMRYVFLPAHPAEAYALCAVLMLTALLLLAALERTTPVTRRAM